jgi:hypothetical protein
MRLLGKTEAYGQRIAREHSKITNGINGKPKQGSGIGKVELLVRKESFWVRLLLVVLQCGLCVCRILSMMMAYEILDIRPLLIDELSSILIPKDGALLPCKDPSY